jgi:transcriptional regulator with XRE-family HTH domain
VSGKLYTQSDIAAELDVKKSHISHIIKGRRSIEISRIEMLERIVGFEIYLVAAPLKLLDKPEITLSPPDSPEHQQIGDNINNRPDQINYYPLLIQKIKSTILQKYPQVTIKERPTTQYLSLNLFGDLVDDKLKRNNLHLLFFKPAKKFQLKVEFMVPYDLMIKYISREKWSNDTPKCFPDDAKVTDFTGGKPSIKRHRPVCIITGQSSIEFDKVAKLALAVFEIQCGLLKPE